MGRSFSVKCGGGGSRKLTTKGKSETERDGTNVKLN